ncbi:MAG TPA: AMP-binding protein [Candidatus Margulisiibacteriota bacterium]|nr:AMP-binding protein [Candidatus Margulisiibacteriota bacterium]
MISRESEGLGLAHHAAAFPAKAAVVVGEKVLAYGALNARVNRLARALRRAGVGVGDAVAAVLPNGCEWLELLNAAGKLGAQLVPVGYRLKGPEIAYMVSDSGAKIIVGAPQLRDEIDRAVGELGANDSILWVTGSDRPWRGRAYEALIGAESVDEPEGGFGGGGFNVLIYTSGTTGRPKGIERAVDAAAAHLTLASIATLWGFGAADVHLVAGPLYHTGPGSYAQLHLLVGGTVVLLPHFDAAEALRLIAHHRVTNTFMVPTHFSRILQLDAAERCRYDLSSLRRVLHSAAPCPAHVKRGIVAVFPPGVVTEFYGASESGFTMITAEEWLKKPGSVGRPWPLHEIRILDEDGKECGPGQVGLIYVHGPRMDFKYRHADDKNRAAFRDGFFTAGDLGYLDDDGYLFIADRRTDLIITGGANVYPAEVESVLMAHPKVADVAVVGLPDPDMGKSVLAVVELRSGARATAEEIVAFARRDLAHYKCPRRVEFVEHLPREPQGKVRKRELVQRYGAQG